jgi:hypothetical protein
MPNLKPEILIAGHLSSGQRSGRARRLHPFQRIIAKGSTNSRCGDKRSTIHGFPPGINL